MQVAPSGGQICNSCKWRHLVAKFGTNASVDMLLLNLIQVTESISGSVVPLAMFSRLPRRTYIGKNEFTEKMCLVQKIAKQVMAESFVSGGLLASRKSMGKGQRK